MIESNIYSVIASKFNAYNNCIRSKNDSWLNRHEYFIEDLVKAVFPHGSGFDNGTKFNWEKSKEDKLVFDTAFHHMDEHGSYDGWTYHQVVVEPSLAFGYKIRVDGRNKNDIKEYITENFNEFYNWKEVVVKLYDAQKKEIDEDKI